MSPPTFVRTRGQPPRASSSCRSPSTAAGHAGGTPDQVAQSRLKHSLRRRASASAGRIRGGHEVHGAGGARGRLDVGVALPHMAGRDVRRLALLAGGRAASTACSRISPRSGHPSSACEWRLAQGAAGDRARAVAGGCDRGRRSGCGRGALDGLQPDDELDDVRGQPLDPITYLGVLIAVLVVTLCAAAVPAWRASRIDPVRVLREP